MRGPGGGAVFRDKGKMSYGCPEFETLISSSLSSKQLKIQVPKIPGLVNYNFFFCWDKLEL